MSTRNRIRVDVAIVGGGVAGLWLLNVLRTRGYSAVLVERSAFGDGQTICSQGMIHGGLKYALGGSFTTAAEAIAAMPQRWRKNLAGDGDVDLRGVEVLSDRYYLWTANDSTLGQLGVFLASKLLRGRAKRLERPEFPEPFADTAFNGAVYELDELVIDAASLLGHLAETHRAYTLCGDVGRDQLIRNDDGTLDSIRLPHAEIVAKRYVLSAGAGNEGIIADLAASATTRFPSMQRRPLHQVIVRAPRLPPLYAHCIDQLANTEPRLTITSHVDARGERVWYVGGHLATGGIDRNGDAQARFARNELTECLPWIDLSNARYESLHVDRVEPAQPGGRRPDEAFVQTVANVLICWPTKLTLAPDLGDKVLAALAHPPSLQPATPVSSNAAAPGVATPPWNR